VISFRRCQPLARETLPVPGPENTSANRIIRIGLGRVKPVPNSAVNSFDNVEEISSPSVALVDLSTPLRIRSTMRQESSTGAEDGRFKALPIQGHDQLATP
jgi:hypothetical protein